MLVCLCCCSFMTFLSIPRNCRLYQKVLSRLKCGKLIENMQRWRTLSGSGWWRPHTWEAGCYGQTEMGVMFGTWQTFLCVSKASQRDFFESVHFFATLQEYAARQIVALFSWLNAFEKSLEAAGMEVDDLHQTRFGPWISTWELSVNLPVSSLFWDLANANNLNAREGMMSMKFFSLIRWVIYLKGWHPIFMLFRITLLLPPVPGAFATLFGMSGKLTIRLSSNERWNFWQNLVELLFGFWPKIAPVPLYLRESIVSQFLFFFCPKLFFLD